MSDNEIIDVFMGYHVYAKSRKYDTSWDWLIPVVQKIETVLHNEMSFNVQINKSDCEIAWTVRPTGKKPPKIIQFKTDDGFGHYTKIQMVYKAVVEFIKWHNQQDHGNKQ